MLLSDAQARPAYLLSTTPGAERLNARPVTQLQPGGRVYQLWLLPGQDAGQGPGAGPVSLGLLDPSAGAGRSRKSMPLVEVASARPTIGAKATTMMESLSATWLSVKCGSPLVRCDHTNTMAVQGAAARMISPAM